MMQAPANASWRDQMEIWFRVLQRKLLTPNHVAGAAALKQAIAACIARTIAGLPPHLASTSDALETKLGSHL
jgi:hypothetical protein